MGWKSFAFYHYSRIKNSSYDPITTQRRTLERVYQELIGTQYGDKHLPRSLSLDYSEYAHYMPITDYESLSTYIGSIQSGQSRILCNSPVKYLLRSSGTTGGSKYIPITARGIRYQLKAIELLLRRYALMRGDARFLDHKMLFLQGSPLLDTSHVVPSGRLSGVVFHEVPRFFLSHRLPSYHINVLDHWPTKVHHIAREMLNHSISVVGGIPPWCIQLWQEVLRLSGAKNLKEIFPSLDLYIHGGVIYEPYRQRMAELLGPDVHTVDTFPASEGFFGLGLFDHKVRFELLCDQGIFYEFRTLDQLSVVSLADAQLGVPYELIISNLSGLYRYAMGDVIRLTSRDPFFFEVSGRTQQFISAFGEHIMAHEVGHAIAQWSAHYELGLIDYHVCPDVEAKRYTWYVEAERQTQDVEMLDQLLCDQNEYYRHLITGQIIQNSQVYWLEQGTFDKYRMTIGRLGEQYKVIQLSNDRVIGDALHLLLNP